MDRKKTILFNVLHWHFDWQLTNSNHNFWATSNYTTIGSYWVGNVGIPKMFVHTRILIPIPTMPLTNKVKKNQNFVSKDVLTVNDIQNIQMLNINFKNITHKICCRLWSRAYERWGYLDKIMLMNTTRLCVLMSWNLANSLIYSIFVQC